MPNPIQKLTNLIIRIVSETNGLTLGNTIELLLKSNYLDYDEESKKFIESFADLLYQNRSKKIPIKDLLTHPFSHAMFEFFKSFPLRYHEEHIHLTGSLTPEFIYPHLMKILNGPKKDKVEKLLKNVYEFSYHGIKGPDDIRELICLKDHQHFDEYLKILFLPKLILKDRQIHQEAAYHMASNLYNNYNVGRIRLKFTLSRISGLKEEILPSENYLSSKDVVLGLYDGFMQFKKEHNDFDFVLTPCFRKELDFYDQTRFKSKKDHIDHQVETILDLLEKFPELAPYLKEVDTVGNEKELFRKVHFMEMKHGFRRLQYKGLKIRSHHGESFETLRKGVQSVDNALNIWRIDTLEHGISLGINPNFYYQRIVDRVIKDNQQKIPLKEHTHEYNEVKHMDWPDFNIPEKLYQGIPLSENEITNFIKTKFHTALETEHYQHDVLNHMINKNVPLISLPTSNLKLTGRFDYYKDHPFSWWEKKGLRLGIGTDNYITLNTNFIQELLILLYSDPDNLKINKLLSVATREKRRAYISNLLWDMRKKIS